VTRFSSREEAGRRLAGGLLKCAKEQPIVLAISRGGVVVGREVARALGVPLDAWVVSKISVPGHAETGVGAVAEGGHVYLSRDIIHYARLSLETVREAVHREAAEVERRAQRWRGGRPPPDPQGRTVILVDDGVATGGTVHAAMRAIRAAGARKVVFAVPVIASDMAESLKGELDEIVCLLTPPDIYAIALWYEDFRAVPDEEVGGVLEQSRRESEQESSESSRP
jgi:putative phosphoribosyl transferase